MEQSGESLSEVLEGTVAVARGLEALQSEHESLLAELGAGQQSGASGGADGEREEEEGFAGLLREQKLSAVNESIDKLQAGITDAKLLLLLSNYTTSLEADKQKLKAQVKRLCAENNWLRKELTDHQQLLLDTELALARAKEDKEHLDFLLAQQKESGSGREKSPDMDIDVQEEEAEGVVRCTSGLLVSGGSHDSLLQGGEGGEEYEVPEKIKTLHHLALQYVNQGKPEVAIPLCKKAVKELEQKKGRDNPDLAAMLNILAVIYREQGKLQDATKTLHETLEIRERVFGVNHAAVASTLNNLSVLYGKSGDFRSAEPYCRKALEIRQKLLGAMHPDVAKQFTNLAILCSHLGKYDEVEYYYQRALEIYQTELGADDPNVAQTMSQLANCYLKQGKYSAAEAIFKKVLNTVQKEEDARTATEPESPIPTSPWIMRTPDSPGVWSKQKSKDDSGGGWHKATTAHSPSVSATLRSLSSVYREQGKVQTADELEKLTHSTVLDENRVAQLLRTDEEKSSIAATMAVAQTANDQTPSPKSQRQAVRPSLSQSVRRLFRLRAPEAAAEDEHTT